MNRLILFLAAIPLFAAGTVTQSVARLNNIGGGVGAVATWTYTLTIVADASDGSVPATVLRQTFPGELVSNQGLTIVSMVTDPGSPAPTDNYDITITDARSMDLLSGAGANRDTSTTENASPTAPIPINGAVTFNLSNNSVNSAQIIVVITVTAATVAKNGGGSSIDLPVTVPNGGTGDTALTAHGVLVGEGASAVAVTSAGTSGQCLTSNGASADPSFQVCAGVDGFMATPTSNVRLDVSAGAAKPGSSYLAAAATSFTLSQYPLASGTQCTNAASMACTVMGTMPSTTTMAVGMQVGIFGASATTCTGLNTPHLITQISGQVVTFGFDSSLCGAITTTGAVIGANASAGGTYYGCVTPAGEVALMMPTGAGLLAVGTGPFLNRQVTSPTCEKTATGANGWYQIFTGTLTTTSNGTYNAPTAVPGGVTMLSLQAGTGMDIPCAGGVCIPAVTSDVTRNSASNTMSGTFDMQTASAFYPPGSNTLPATCTLGQQYIDQNATAAAQLYICTATNTWTAQGGAGTIAGALSANAGTVAFGTGTANTVTDDTTNFAYNSTTKILTAGNATQYVKTGALINGGILGSGAYGCQWGSVSPTNANWNICLGPSHFYQAPSGGNHFFYIAGVEYANITTSAFTSNTTIISSGTVKGTKYLTTTNCADPAGAAACGSASSGAFVIDANTTSTVVSTTAVSSTSRILYAVDSSLGTELGITCNTQSLLVLGAPKTTARTASTSFTTSVEVAPTALPLCISYWIAN